MDSRLLVAGSLSLLVLAGRVRRGSGSVPAQSPLAGATNPVDVEGLQGLLSDLLARLRALHWSTWTHHWQAHGRSSYGDHLLLERLYTDPLQADIDTLAERMVAFFGNDSVSERNQARQLWVVLGEVDGEHDPWRRALKMERNTRSAIGRALQWAQGKKILTIGLENLLGELADHREVALYLIQQRAMLDPEDLMVMEGKK